MLLLRHLPKLAVNWRKIPVTLIEGFQLYGFTSTTNLLLRQAHFKQGPNVWCAENLEEEILVTAEDLRSLALGCAIVFCKCFRDYFRSAAFARLFDDADDVLIAHPHRAVRVVFYAVSV